MSAAAGAVARKLDETPVRSLIPVWWGGAVCRLFGLHATERVRATFWLLDAPDSLSVQSRREPDGAGIGVFDDHGDPVVDKAPIAAWRDREFATAARTLASSTFVAHVRYASTGALSTANTHPFAQQGRIFAHNGAIGGLPELDARLAELGTAQLVSGQTDSERMFALITAEVARASGDVGAGIVGAMSWLAENLPVYSLNLLLSTPGQLWALRYPETNELWVLQRPAARSDAPLEARSARIHARSTDLSRRPAVIVASEPMDADPGWRSMAVGELLHVSADGKVTSAFPLPASLHHPLTLQDLNETAAASQRPLHPSVTSEEH